MCSTCAPPHLEPIRVGTDAELRVLADALLDDLREMLQRGTVLLRLVVAQRNVVR